MRTILAILAALILASIPAAATAKPPSRFSDTSVNLYCDGIAPTSGTAFAYLGVSYSLNSGGSAFLDMWYAASPSGAPDVSSDFSEPVTVTWNGSQLGATFPVLTSTGSPAGNAVVNAMLAPAGPAVAIKDRFHFGNQFFRATGTLRPMSATGTLTAGGRTFSLDGCYADLAVISDFSTNPNAFVFSFTDRSVGCDLSNAAGDIGYLFVDLNSSPSSVFVGLISPDGSALAAFGEVDIRSGSASASIPVVDLYTGNPVAGSADLQISITEGETFNYVLRNATQTRRVSSRLGDIEGQVTFPGGQSFDLGACVAVDQRVKRVETNPSGPKAGGKAPANDLPSGAIALKVGGKASVQTKGAALLAEAAYPCMTFDDGAGGMVDIPVGNTVWYKVTGTGTDVTVDTAGSDYDTVLAVYTAGAGGGFDPIACVDDVPLVPFGRTLQAAATFPTTVGTTYYVQIGGFPESFTYGNLRVAVR